MKVLLVDDDPSVVAALEAALIPEGSDAIAAFNGPEAIRSFYTHPHSSIASLHAGEKGVWDTFERIARINTLLPISSSRCGTTITVADSAGIGALMVSTRKL